MTILFRPIQMDQTAPRRRQSRTEQKGGSRDRRCISRMDDHNVIVPLCQTIASHSPDSFGCAASYLLNPSLPLMLPVPATTLCFMAPFQALRQCLEHHQLSGGWMTGVSTAIDNGRPSRLSVEQCFFISLARLA